jgi:LuxR family transcriptional regulator, maltose regulon positive regulatory protein
MEVVAVADRPGQAAIRGRWPAGSPGGPILASKITVPDVPDWAVPRPRVTQLIARGARWCPLTVLTGPASAGKTTALALWVAAEPRVVAWVTVDEYDNRPEVFWSSVVAALLRSGIAMPRTAAARGRPGDDPFLLRFATALATCDPPVTLVLDDLHLLTEPKVLQGLDLVLRNVGSGLRLAVASRIDPPLPLHRYRAAGQLNEVRASDLAFSAAEVGVMLAQHRRAVVAAAGKAGTGSRTIHDDDQQLSKDGDVW